MSGKYTSLVETVRVIFDSEHWLQYWDWDSTSDYICHFCGASVSEKRRGSNPEFRRIERLIKDKALTVPDFPHDANCVLCKIWNVVHTDNITTGGPDGTD